MNDATATIETHGMGQMYYVPSRELPYCLNQQQS
jgi:hypothetical protein